ncbi:glycosyltransferase family 9 protein [Enterovibrio norvegicus]|uniref:Glycosyl transferase n=1 Tax=Enterovibrio norvegicus TaxID=188144 RepID=A0A2N7LEH0_9GAMM|nr:glycosyltransferase family 9 protein [Enterovibrio norvegicus]PML79789.1 glycosyl transferase [Enterovibrio norvegicus]PMN69893.1 glycosyl transferase [Enterovibrio norvegicus]PMN93799.1 glycosyl transferase [Enterovibrio norvegicus]
MLSSAPKSICVLRLSAIGDVCNTIAAIQAIQKHWPNVQVTWITGKLEAKLLESIDGIEVIVFDKNTGISGYRALWKHLDGRIFDVLLHMQYAIRASIATLGIKAEYKLGFAPDRSQDLQTLFTNVKVTSPQSLHVADGFMAFALSLGVPASALNWALSYSEQDQHWAQSNIVPNKPSLLLVAGASKAYKNWNVAGYVEVIKHAQTKGWQILLAGSPSTLEIDLAESIQTQLAEPCVNLVGKSSILQMLALIDHADMVITPDTGPAHMASAMNTPIIGLYAHHNPSRVGPYNYLKYAVSVYEEAVFAETGKSIEELNWRTRVKDKTAMSRIQSQDVIEMFDRVIDDFNMMGQ